MLRDRGRTDDLGNGPVVRRLMATGMTHRGARRRGNEDMLGIAGWSGNADMEQPVQRLLSLRAPFACAVADGLGGHEGGALASSIVIARLAREVMRLNDATAVANLVASLETDLTRLASERGFAKAPGSTLAALIVRGERQPMLAINIGDSRIYRISVRGTERLSTDDTPATGSEAEDTDDRTGLAGHALVQAIGGGHAPKRLTPHVIEVPLRADERYFLCTDGVTDVMGNSEINAFSLRHHDDDTAFCAAVFAECMARGGPDNITLCLLRPMH